MLACTSTATSPPSVSSSGSSAGTTHGGRSSPDVPFYSVDTFDDTVPFYLGRTVTFVREQGELAWGIADASAQLHRGRSSEFERRWRAGGEAYAIMGQLDVRRRCARNGPADAASSTATGGA